MAGFDNYRNGSYISTSTGFSGSLAVVPYIGCYNSIGTPSNFLKFDLLWMTIYSGTLSAAQVAAVLAAAPI
jgi:hypothetical protein